MPLKTLNIINISIIGYRYALKLQKEYHAKRVAGAIEDTLFLLQHYPVITIGRSGGKQNLLVSEKFLEDNGIDLNLVGRGGDITYHGPGQLVGYLIFNLNNHQRDVHKLVRNTEQAVIDVLKIYNINGTRITGIPGVFVNNNKIAAIGYGIKKWVSYHGFAFNINMDKTPFSYIVPCGINNKGVTTLNEETGKHCYINKIKKEISDSIQSNFNFNKILNSGVKINGTAS